MLLSVCIIARNEAEFLPECLESVVSVADEIILVDTGSEDATIELARRYGCRVFAVPWEEDFSAARNFALSQAQGEWILSLDADERLCNAELLHDTLLQASPDVGGFLLEHLSTDAEGNRHRTWLLRLFRNHPHIRFRGRIHEQVALRAFSRRATASAPARFAWCMSATAMWSCSGASMSATANCSCRHFRRNPTAATCGCNTPAQRLP
jgi:glycosyltransferase involved in cell wall biosynthesis